MELKEGRYCESCGKELFSTLTNHYCLRCLGVKARQYKISSPPINTKASFNKEFEKIVAESRAVEKSSYEILKDQYLEELRHHPVMLSELCIASDKFLNIIRHLKMENEPVHYFKFRCPGRMREDGIAYLTEHKKIACAKLMNIYPQIKPPRFLTH